jgi:hypothetical protein
LKHSLSQANEQESNVGPIALFDKSFLQSLNEEESLWFDHFFHANVCPIFYVETQADLAKETSKKFTPEQLVEHIARKFPEHWGAPNVYHPNIITANLLGNVIPMDGQVIISSVSSGSVDGHAVLAYPESPEAQAFLRWTQRQFRGEEREAGRFWRTSGFGTDSKIVIDHLQKIGAYDSASCPTLKHVLAEVDRVLNKLTSEEELALALLLFGMPEEPTKKIIERFQEAGKPPLATFGNYTLFALRLELFYHIAVHKGRMGKAQRMDMNYLFYLPFCDIFVSADWVHIASAPLFLRERQEFIQGPKMKAALVQLNERYLAVPDAQTKSIAEIAPRPPLDGNNLVTEIWDRQWPTWREPKKENEGADKEIKWVKEHSAEIGNILQGIPSELSAGASGYRALVRTKTVRIKRGRWFTVPEVYRKNYPDK